jgi:hypothetical protein
MKKFPPRFKDYWTTWNSQYFCDGVRAALRRCLSYTQFMWGSVPAGRGGWGGIRGPALGSLLRARGGERGYRSPKIAPGSERKVTSSVAANQAVARRAVVGISSVWLTSVMLVEGSTAEEEYSGTICRIRARTLSNPFKNSVLSSSSSFSARILQF